MNTFEEEELTDMELSELLSVWQAPDPPRRMWMRAFEPKPWHAGVLNRRSMVTGMALALQGCALLLLLATYGPTGVTKLLHHESLIYLRPFRPANLKGGGGGGQASQPAVHGAAPQFAQKQFVPPTVTIVQPKLAAPTSISAKLPDIEARNYGDPLSHLTGNGLGAGSETGIGSGHGSGYEPGNGGADGGGLYRAGGDVSAPVLLTKVDPEYSDQARVAKLSGSVLLNVVVNERGVPVSIRVVRPLGLGLDERAVEAVKQWRFRPGTKGGHPVPVEAVIEVSFRLL